MSLKSGFVLFIIVSQLASWTAVADPIQADVAAPSPEFVLLQDTIALSGMTLSPSEENDQVNVVITRYLATAPTEGQAQRLQQALIDLNMTTPQEAAAIVTDAQSLNADLSANAPLQQQNDRITHSIVQLVARHPFMGAQFSTACEVGGAIGLSGLGMIAFVGIATEAGMNIGSGSILSGGWSSLSYIGLGAVITVAGGIVMAATCFR